MQKLLVSVSGGRSSALMAFLLWTRLNKEYRFLFVFANTSREKEETLLFIHQLEKYFGFPIVWVEALVHHGKRIASTYTITDYKNAKRDGEIFEEVIKKYGIPNKKFKHCTRELKANPIKAYAKNNGFGGALIAIGYRKDEPKRVNLLTAEQKKQWYPLYDYGITKVDVAAFWKKQKFDLQLEDWEGNCKLCFKKSKRKLLTQIVTDPKSTEFIEVMENRYEDRKPGKRARMKEPSRFFRGSDSILDLIDESKHPFAKAVDQSLISEGSKYDFELDETDGCEESCEPFSL